MEPVIQEFGKSAGREFTLKICDILGINPENILGIDIRLSMDGPVLVTTSSYIPQSKVNDVALVFQQYRVVEGERWGDEK
jgi:hypothetical protein